MIPKEAIYKAIEGGWKVPFDAWTTDAGGVIFRYPPNKHGGINSELWLYEQIALDPSFWQSLAKEYKTGLPFKMHTQHLPQWHQQALRFYDLILTGGSTDEFWVKLLK